MDDQNAPQNDPPQPEVDLKVAWSNLAADRLEGKIGGFDDNPPLKTLEGPFFEDHSAEHPLEGRCARCSKAVDDHDGLLLCLV